MSFVFMSDQIFLLSYQNGALVGHMSFQGKKIICSPAFLAKLGVLFGIYLLGYVINIRGSLWVREMLGYTVKDGLNLVLF